jgi:chromosome segregation ATPase
MGCGFSAADNAIEAAQGHLQLLDASMQALEAERALHRQSEVDVSAQIEALLALVNPAEAELDQIERQQESMQSAEAAARQELSKAEHTHAQAKIALARRQEAIETWRRRIEDDFGLFAFEYFEGFGSYAIWARWWNNCLV